MIYNFFPPEKSEILLFNKNSDLFFKYLKRYKFSELNLEKEINIFIIMRLILKFKKINVLNYYIEFIKIANPKILITFIDNNIIFYKLKNIFPTIKFKM